MTAPYMDLIKPHLSGALEPAIQQQLDLTVIDFLKQSLLWKEDLGPYDIDVDEASFSLALTGPVRNVAFVHGVWFNGTKLPPMVDREPRGLWATGLAPTHYMVELPETLYFRPVPTTYYVDALYIKASVYPASANDAPAWLGQRYAEQIAAGTLSRMMLQPDKPYTNTKMAMYHSSVFRNGHMSARRAALASFEHGAQPWQFPYFAGNRR